MSAARPPVLKDVLFEIGTEELPAANLADVFETAAATGENILETRARKAFEEKRLSFQGCRVWATPRRIVFWFSGVAAAQSPKESRIKILSRQEAFDAEGKPTEKFLLILRYKSASLEETVVSDLNGRPYVFIRKAEPARKAVSVLPEIFSGLVSSLPFPKMMRWDDSGLYFPRPIRSFLCFYGDRSVSFKIGNTRVTNETVIFKKAARRRFAVKDIPAYFKLLEKHGILLDPSRRKKAILDELKGLTAAFDARLYEDAFLLGEVNFLVENPQGLSAPFDGRFLELPPEVLTVSMARKQRIFGALDGEGKVLPRFFAILDGPAGDKEKKTISKNMENILHAKLEDSLFFFKEDTKTPLERKREELKNLVFLKGAGSMLEKSDRLVRLAGAAAEELELGEKERSTLLRAAYLSKADLLTQMVGEFPELQGIMGKHYALASGEPAEAAAAIAEQYLPRTVQDQPPRTLVGSLLSILDKCDLVTACFALGLEPTSSLDPYGLRRSAAAVLKILVDQKIPLSLSAILSQAAIQLGDYVPRERWPELSKKLNPFFKDRFLAVMADRRFREDLVEAAVASGFEVPYETYLRIAALAPLFRDSCFPKAWKVVERTANILKASREPLPEAVNPSLFAEELERGVWRHYEDSRESIGRAAAERNYQLATSLYAEAFFDILGEFFEKVFVNADDPSVRRNRLVLLRSIQELYTAKIADLSKIRLNQEEVSSHAACDSGKDSKTEAR